MSLSLWVNCLCVSVSSLNTTKSRLEVIAKQQGYVFSFAAICRIVVTPLFYFLTSIGYVRKGCVFAFVTVHQSCLTLKPLTRMWLILIISLLCMFLWKTLSPGIHVDVILTCKTHSNIVSDKSKLPHGSITPRWQGKEPRHNTKTTLEWGKMSSNKELKGVTWPPHSQDPNSIGHTWATSIHRGPTLLTHSTQSIYHQLSSARHYRYSPQRSCDCDLLGKSHVHDGTSVDHNLNLNWERPSQHFQLSVMNLKHFLSGFGGVAAYIVPSGLPLSSRCAGAMEGIALWSDAFVSGCIHMIARIEGFTAELCTVAK